LNSGPAPPLGGLIKSTRKPVEAFKNGIGNANASAWPCHGTRAPSFRYTLDQRSSLAGKNAKLAGFCTSALESSLVTGLLPKTGCLVGWFAGNWARALAENSELSANVSPRVAAALVRNIGAPHSYHWMRGKRTENVDPRPSLLSTVTLPPAC
jgi:hypothetical protein